MARLIDKKLADEVAEITRGKTREELIRLIEKQAVIIKQLRSSTSSKTEQIDCISRQAVELRINKFLTNETYTEGMLIEDIHNLPSNLSSAEPEREKGRWIPVSCKRRLGEAGILIKEYVETSDPYDVVAVKCSKCGEVFDFDDARYFCSHCGADMRKGGKE